MPDSRWIKKSPDDLAAWVAVLATFSRWVLLIVVIPRYSPRNNMTTAAPPINRAILSIFLAKYPTDRPITKGAPISPSKKAEEKISPVSAELRVEDVISVAEGWAKTGCKGSIQIAKAVSILFILTRKNANETYQAIAVRFQSTWRLAPKFLFWCKSYAKRTKTDRMAISWACPLRAGYRFINATLTIFWDNRNLIYRHIYCWYNLSAWPLIGTHHEK